MSVALVWLPHGHVDPEAGLDVIERLGDEGLRRSVDDDDVWNWANDLRDDIALYESAAASEPLENPSPTEAAKTFVRAFTLAADHSVAQRGLLTRIELDDDGVILAAGGEFGSSNPISFATLYTANDIFSVVAEAMGAVPPDQWTLSRRQT